MKPKSDLRSFPQVNPSPQPSKKSRRSRGAALAKLIALSVGSSFGTANAATATWDGAVSGVWDMSTTANWSGTTFASGDDAVFTATPVNNVATATGLTVGAITLNSGFTGSVALTGNNTVNGATTISGGNLLVKQAGAAVGTVTATNLGTSAVTINSGGQLYVDDEGNGTAAGERILAIGNTITGAGTLQARPSTTMTNGWSSVNLTGNLSGFTGTFNVLAGSTLNRGKAKFTAASQAAVLSSSATVNVANGAQLYLNQAYNYGFGIHLNGGAGGENFGSLRLDNATLDVTGALTLHADSIISGAGKISGAIGESGGSYRLTKVANNTTVLTGPNTYSGGTSISVGTVSVGNNSALGSGPVTMTGGTLLAGAPSLTLPNDIGFSTGANQTVQLINGDLTLGGSMSTPAASSRTTFFYGTGTLGQSILNLTGTSTINYGGATFMAAVFAKGITVNVKNAASLTVNGIFTNCGFMNIGDGGNGSAIMNVESGGAVTNNGNVASVTTSGIGSSGNAAGSGTANVSGTLTYGDGQNVQIGSTVTGSFGTLNINSGGVVNLNNSARTVTVDARGTVNLNSGGTINSARIWNAGTGAFNFNGGTLKAAAAQTLASGLTVTTTSPSSAIDSNSFTVGIDNAISGAGGLTIIDSSGSGTGVVTLGGANIYAGTTSVTSGTLAITGSLTGLVSVSGAGKLAVGEITPSTTMATLSLSTLSLSTGGVIGFDVTSPSSNDQVTVTTPSGLSISGGGVYLYDAGTTLALSQTGTFTLINYNGTLTGSVAGLTVANSRVGYAYVFGNTGSAITVTVSLTNDTDNDGMPDVYEDANGLNKLVNDAGGNLDGDFSTNYEEYLAGTDPQDAGSDPKDSDADGLEDSWEVAYFTTITAQDGSGDPDGDFATNTEEQSAFTDPSYRGSAPDSDGDGIGDAWESVMFENNLEIADETTDFDGDEYLDIDEFIAGTDPNNALETPDDTDADGLADAWETTYFPNLNQTGGADTDGDHATHEEEETASTNPTVRTSAPDSEPDGMGDAWEVYFFTNTTTATATSDSDSDTVTDVNEFLNNSDPTNPLDPYSGTTVITWATPVTVTADTDILTTGALLHAGNFRSDNANVSVTVGPHTIAFENRQSQDAAGTLLTGEEARVIAGSGGRQVAAALFNAAGTSVTALFESVLDSSAWENGDPGPAPGATDMVLRVTGVDGAALVTGQSYQIQLFYSDDRGGNTTRGQVFHDDTLGGTPSATMLAGDSKYVIGTFTAGSSGYQDIFIRNTSGGGNFPVGLNGYVLRTVPSGSYTSWADANSASGQTVAQDHDGDGVKNGIEYFMGETGSSFTANPPVVTAGAVRTVTWPMDDTYTGVYGTNYKVQTSGNLTTWDDVAQGSVTITPGVSVAYTLPAGGGKLFVRLVVTN